MIKIPKELKPEQVVVAQDSREQNPLDLSPLQSVVTCLPTGDYGLMHAPDVACIERKNIDDLVGSLTHERERFEKEIVRMLAYPVRALVCEADWIDIETHNYRSKAHPNSILGSLMGIIATGVPVIMIGDHARAGKWVSRMLYLAAKRRWLENYSLLESALKAV